MLGKIASAGQNGQFRTPRHIIALMVALTAPTARDVICDPASGTCGFLVAAAAAIVLPASPPPLRSGPPPSRAAARGRGGAMVKPHTLGRVPVCANLK